LTDQERLEYLRKIARFDLPDRLTGAKERAARAQYDAIADKLESQTPRSY